MTRRFLVAWAVAAVLTGGTEALAQKGKDPDSLADLKGVTNAAYAPDGSYLLAAYSLTPNQFGEGPPSLGVFDAATGKRLVTLEKPPTRCDRVAVSPDGKKAAAVANGPRQLKVWDAASGK